MDAYNYRFNKVTVGVENKKRCVDDSLLYSETLEKSFIQAANYLSLKGNNGIIQYPEKFQFGSKTVASQLVQTLSNLSPSTQKP